MEVFCSLQLSCYLITLSSSLGQEYQNVHKTERKWNFFSGLVKHGSPLLQVTSSQHHCCLKHVRYSLLGPDTDPCSSNHSFLVALLLHFLLLPVKHTVTYMEFYQWSTWTKIKVRLRFVGLISIRTTTTPHGKFGIWIKSEKLESISGLQTYLIYNIFTKFYNNNRLFFFFFIKLDVDGHPCTSTSGSIHVHKVSWSIIRCVVPYKHVSLKKEKWQR